MPYKSKKTTYKPRRKMGRGLRRPKPRRLTNIHHFNEMFSLGPVTLLAPAGLGNVFGVKLTDIPQVANYNTLYTQYKITGAKLVFVPRLTSTDSSVVSGATTSGVANSRMVYAIQDSADYNPPTSEADVMACNGVKIRSLNRPVTIKFRPVPRFEQVDGSSGLEIGVGRKPQWINFDGHGDDVLHFGVNAWFTTPINSTTSLPLSVADVYCYISFACRDPR